MEKNKIQIILFTVLMLAGAMLWIYPYFKKKGSAKETITGRYEVIEIKEPVYKEDFFTMQKQLEEKRPKLEWTRNPFIPPQKETKSTVGELVLSGIAVDERGRIAIINGEIVREGDVIFGVKIIEITQDSVTVEGEGKSYTLKLY